MKDTVVNVELTMKEIYHLWAFTFEKAGYYKSRSIHEEDEKLRDELHETYVETMAISKKLYKLMPEDVYKIFSPDL